MDLKELFLKNEMICSLRNAVLEIIENKMVRCPKVMRAETGDKNFFVWPYRYLKIRHISYSRTFVSEILSTIFSKMYLLVSCTCFCRCTSKLYLFVPPFFHISLLLKFTYLYLPLPCTIVFKNVPTFIHTFTDIPTFSKTYVLVSCTYVD